ncbi:alpha/beta-hydrolase [Marasmius fiardii PR-910]|nr:alpha/beta-hydrolase [Marasmius fiardii PR-910]
MASSITLIEKLSLFPKLLSIPVIIIYTALVSPFSRALRRKKWYRLIFETSLRALAKVTSVRQFQWLNGTQNSGIYKKWANSLKVEAVIDDVPQSGKKLMWIGNKNAEKVVFYVHGGGYMLPVSDFMYTFWLFVQREYAKRTGKEIAICSMEYSLYPQTFPTQLTEIIHAFSHFLSNTKATPSNIHIAGDSAGGNLIFQLISHTLHPVSGVPSSPLTTTRVRGVLLISPWLSLNENTPSHVQNHASDIVAPSTLISWGDLYLQGVKDSQLPYVKNLLAVKQWYEGVDKLTDRILITAGDAECLLDDSIMVYERLSGVVKGIPDVRLDIEEGGTHEDMMVDVAAGGKNLTAAGEKIVEWLREGNGDA